MAADGGASRDRFLMQFQADVIGREVRRPAIRETTALGAAYLAGLAAGFWTGQDEIKRNWAVDRTFTPSIPEGERDEKLRGWHRAVERSFGWAKE